MPHTTSECLHEAEIAKIATSLEHVASTLIDMKTTQDKLVSLLEKVAAQDARLDHLEEHHEEQYRSMDNIFTRLRDLELNQAAYGPETKLHLQEIVEEVTRKIESINVRIEKIMGFIRMITSKKAKWIYGFLALLTVMGAFSDYEFHREWFKAVANFLKGFLL